MISTSILLQSTPYKPISQLGDANITGVTSIAMNDAGDRIAIGHTSYTIGARVYSWLGSAWTQLGDDFATGSYTNTNDSVISMNAAGDRVAIFSDTASVWNPFTNTGTWPVKIFSWSGSAWSQLGNGIESDSQGSWGTGFGKLALSLNAAGNRLAIGSSPDKKDATTGNGTFYGRVIIYSLIGSTWTQLGNEINGKAANDWFGNSISLNAAGDILAVGAPNVVVNGSYVGAVSIFKLINNTWTQRGSDIIGTTNGASLGETVSINAEGDVVAIGSRGEGVKLYSWSGTAWIQLASLGGSIPLINTVGDRVYIGGSVSIIDYMTVYETSNTVWSQLINNVFGRIVDFTASRAGNRFALVTNEGICKVYEIGV